MAGMVLTTDNAPALVNFFFAWRTHIAGRAAHRRVFVISDGRAENASCCGAVRPRRSRISALPNALGNPRVRLYQNGVQILQNDDWAAVGDPTASETAFARPSAPSRFHGTSKDAAIIAILQPRFLHRATSTIRPVAPAWVLTENLRHGTHRLRVSFTPPAPSDPANKPVRLDPRHQTTA